MHPLDQRQTRREQIPSVLGALVLDVLEGPAPIALLRPAQALEKHSGAELGHDLTVDTLARVE
jgi:hypothetical protein